VANGIQRYSEMRPAVLWLAALTPIGAAIATWTWSRCADRIYPDWFRKACLEGVPPPFWASDAPVIVPVCMIVVGLLICSVLWRRGHGWLSSIVCVYYVAALALIAMGNVPIAGHLCK
jgi:hypothetical protein